jgi:hypothetical protein
MGLAVDRRPQETEGPGRISGTSRLVEVDPSGVLQRVQLLPQPLGRVWPSDQSGELLEGDDRLAATPRRLDLVDEELEDQIAERIELAGLKRSDDS